MSIQVLSSDNCVDRSALLKASHKVGTAQLRREDERKGHAVKNSAVVSQSSNPRLVTSMPLATTAYDETHQNVQPYAPQTMQAPPWLNVAPIAPTSGKPNTTLSPRLSKYKVTHSQRQSSPPSSPPTVYSDDTKPSSPPTALPSSDDERRLGMSTRGDGFNPSAVAGGKASGDGAPDSFHHITVKYHQKQPLVAAPLPSHRAPAQRVSTAPRRSQHKLSGLCFLVIVVHIIVFQYFTYASLLLRPLVYPNWTAHGIGLVVVFHLLFILTIWSFIQCVITDPGTVPPNWGFYMGDKNKRRRYCQVCNIWKPDRTHHCSACDRCILNMDHHCPWINNCVGFYNRKFFIQLLCTALASLIWVSIHGCVVVFLNSFSAEQYGWNSFGEVSAVGLSYALDVVSYCLLCVMLFIAVALAFPLIPFLRFHLGLIAHNSTTIESMPSALEMRHIDHHSRPSYDIGVQRNIEQVLGRKCIWWWLPMHTAASRPVGDGVRWRQSYLTAIEDETQRV